MNRECRFCSRPLEHLVVDLGQSPLCESFLSADEVDRMEPFYPLRAYVCDACFLVQVQQYVDGETIFGGDYAYFSSFSDSWLAHCEQYTNTMIHRLGLAAGRSSVVEIASNDGYLLQFFKGKGIDVLGIEPAGNVARAAMDKGICTRVEFFGLQTAQSLRAEGVAPDLLIGNNVLAHVPNLNDFVAGLQTLLPAHGVLTMEFPHLMQLLQNNQFDTIYQEHYCYFSLHSASAIFAKHGLTIFDVEEVPTHGGSLRVFVGHARADLTVSDAVDAVHQREAQYGIAELGTYAKFAEQVAETKRQLLEFLIDARRNGKSVVGYGAPGKGNTLLNYCGIRQDFIDFVVDRNPYKHGKFLPGTHIPVYPVERIDTAKPDYLLILPWNLRDEIVEQMAHVRSWGAQFVVPIPQLEIV